MLGNMVRKTKKKDRADGVYNEMNIDLLRKQLVTRYDAYMCERSFC